MTDVALALHRAPGVYAILLGSGVSRAAQIPTGWEVVSDLIRRLAVADGHEASDDPPAWYREEYDRDADYSEIVEQLAATPAERQALLRDYFEPTDDEREDGIKVPSAAHHAIADLARRGIVRVILTTNFDRLMEQALDAAGVAHDVWSTPDAIAGGVPLVHGNVVVVKLHGDYRDTRVRNTMTELEAYEPGIDELLDQVLDQFGLIVCGWSGDWDAALRDAIMRAKRRRYRTFWAARGGQVRDAGQQVVDHRAATVVPIDGADEFFVAINEKAAAIAEARRAHPETVEVAVATVKRLIPSPQDRIRLQDFVLDQARPVSDVVGSDRYPRRTPEKPTVEAVVQRAREFAGLAEIPAAVLAQLAAHADREDHARTAARALEIIANQDNEHDGYTVFVNLRRLPALLCFYAAGIAAVANGQWAMLHEIALTPRLLVHQDEHVLAAALNPFLVLDQDEIAQALARRDQSGGRLHTPMSDFLRDELRSTLLPLVDNDARYDECFDRFEYLIGLLVIHLRLSSSNDGPLIPQAYVGRVRWRHRAPSLPPPATWAHEHRHTLAEILLADHDAPMTAWQAAKDEYDDLRNTARQHTMMS